MTLGRLRGQDRAARRLLGLLSTGRIPGGLLFHGPEGVGKRRAALEFAKALLSRERPEEAEAVERSVEGGSCPDVRVVDASYQAHLLEKEPDKSLDKQREWRVDTLREICGEMQRRSFSGGWKTAILDDAHRMNLEAQNALLKMLEEPPPRSLWILVSSQPGRLLPTVRSRSHAVSFGRLEPGVLRGLLEEQGLTSEEARELSSFGSLSDALREREAREAFSGLAGPLAPLKAGEGLPKELASARLRVELALDHLSNAARTGWTRDLHGTAARLRRLQRLRGHLRRNVSPGLILQLAFWDRR